MDSEASSDAFEMQSFASFALDTAPGSHNQSTQPESGHTTPSAPISKEPPLAEDCNTLVLLKDLRGLGPFTCLEIDVSHLQSDEDLSTRMKEVYWGHSRGLAWLQWAVFGAPCAIAYVEFEHRYGLVPIHYRRENIPLNYQAFRLLWHLKGAHTDKAFLKLLKPILSKPRESWQPETKFTGIWLIHRTSWWRNLAYGFAIIWVIMMSILWMDQRRFDLILGLGAIGGIVTGLLFTFYVMTWNKSTRSTDKYAA